MKYILLFGAGKSATCLIDYLVAECKNNDWQLTVCDADILLAESKIKGAKNTKAVSINVVNEQERRNLISAADIVISMLPAALHLSVAKDCIEFGKNLLTASYADSEIRSLEKEVSDKKLLFLCEMGLDPGIDHMSAMKLINSVKSSKGKITSFKSHCGGLIAPESDDNPWHYKITWNSRNVVLAGREGSVYRQDNKTIKIAYPSIFTNNNTVDVPGLNRFAWYPNRDSLNYISLYGLEEIQTFIRTTLRHPAFCRGWNKIVNIGLTQTDDYEKIKNCKTFYDWYQLKISPFISNNRDWQFYLQMYITDPHKDEFSRQSHYIGLQSKELLPKGFTCSADILQYAMETKLFMHARDKDMIVMLHELAYTQESRLSTVNSSLIVKGEDGLKTAMAKTVGLPLGIATKLILQEKIKLKGLHIPTVAEIYEPVLKELEDNGIIFTETRGGLSE